MRAVERVAASRAGSWYFLNVAMRIDRRLLPLTNGRLSISVGQPVGLLETVGAKSGQTRQTPLLYLAHGRDVVLVASSGGATRHPAWYHNLRANPTVSFLAPRRTGRYRARVVEGEERERLWAEVNALYGGYATYQLRTAGRTIPVVVLSPLDPS
jgi:F420H(2)-dependent quinone reductase